MTAAVATPNRWDSLFGGNEDAVRKMLFGSFLVRDYDFVNSMDGWLPFDENGDLLDLTDPAQVPGPNPFYDLGYIDENGVQFTPTYTMSDTATWQSRRPIRSDVTEDTEVAKVVSLETKPAVMALHKSRPLTGIGGFNGQPFVIKKPRVPQVIYRTCVAIGVDGDEGNEIYGAVIYTKCLVTKPDKQDWQAKAEVQWDLTFSPYPDRLCPESMIYAWDGPGWRALGNTEAGSAALSPGVTPPGTPTLSSHTPTSATIAWAASTGGEAPLTYDVLVNGIVRIAGTSSLTASLTGLTTGTAYSVTVVAHDSAGLTSMPSAALSVTPS